MLVFKTEQLILEIRSSKTDVHAGVSFEFDVLKHRRPETPLFDQHTRIQLEARYLSPRSLATKETFAFIEIGDLQFGHLAKANKYGGLKSRDILPIEEGIRLKKSVKPDPQLSVGQLEKVRGEESFRWNIFLPSVYIGHIIQLLNSNKSLYITAEVQLSGGKSRSIKHFSIKDYAPDELEST